jgi:hypothetical protein
MTGKIGWKIKNLMVLDNGRWWNCLEGWGFPHNLKLLWFG